MKLLLISDDFQEVNFFKALFNRLSLDFETSNNPKLIGGLLLTFHPEVILISSKSKKFDALQTVNQMKAKNKNQKFILLKTVQTQVDDRHEIFDFLLDSPTTAIQFVNCLVEVGGDRAKLESKLKIDTKSASKGSEKIVISSSETDSASPGSEKMVISSSEKGSTSQGSEKMVISSGDAKSEKDVLVVKGETEAEDNVQVVSGEEKAKSQVQIIEGEAEGKSQTQIIEGEAQAKSQVEVVEGEAADKNKVQVAKGEAAAKGNVQIVEGEAAGKSKAEVVKGEASKGGVAVVKGEGTGSEVNYVGGEASAADTPAQVSADGAEKESDLYVEGEDQEYVQELVNRSSTTAKIIDAADADRQVRYEQIIAKLDPIDTSAHLSREVISKAKKKLKEAFKNDDLGDLDQHKRKFVEVLFTTEEDED